jgi:hypothetical protein
MTAQYDPCARCPLAAEPAICPRSVDDYCPKAETAKQEEFPINFEAVETD